MFPSSRGLGHVPFTDVTGVRIPLGTPLIMNNSPLLEVKYISEQMGRGVFATTDILENTLIEASNIAEFIFFKESIIIGKDGKKQVIKNRLPDGIASIYFEWGFMVDDNYEKKCIALGLGSLFNHSDKANVRYNANKEQRQMEYYTVRDIQKGEQLFINYDGIKGNSFSDGKRYFGV